MGLLTFLIALVLAIATVCMIWLLVSMFMASRADPKARLGRKTWAYLHALVENLSPDESESYYELVTEHIESLAKVYPCLQCRTHFAAYMTVHPLPFSRVGLIRWMFDFHNAVNERLGKPRMRKDQYRALQELNNGNDPFGCGSCDIPLVTINTAEMSDNRQPPPPYRIS